MCAHAKCTYYRMPLCNLWLVDASGLCVRAQPEPDKCIVDRCIVDRCIVDRCIVDRPEQHVTTLHDGGASCCQLHALTMLLPTPLLQVNQNLNGGFPVVLDNLWLSSEESESVASALVPKLEKTKEAVEQVGGEPGVLRSML
jgi:hypothetical protein